MSHREKQRNFDQWYGGMLTGCFLISALIIYIALAQILWLMPFVFIAITITIIFDWRSNMLKDFLKKISGVKIVEMKLSAVANYMKVKFVHVPEHYECQKITTKA